MAMAIAMPLPGWKSWPQKNTSPFALGSGDRDRQLHSLKNQVAPKNDGFQ